MRTLAGYTEGANRRGMQEKWMLDLPDIGLEEERKDVAAYPGLLRAMLLQR
jgi:hypothetical protein